MSRDEIEFGEPGATCAPHRSDRLRSPFCVAMVVLVVTVVGGWSMLAVGYRLGRSNQSSAPALPIPLAAATAASSDNMAMATGQVTEDAEGVFFLDYNTGDLQCLIFYPRNGAFGARFFTNVRPQLGGMGKNSKYLMVTGNIGNTPTSGGGARPGGALVYVTDVTTGLFAAYAIPWNRTMESSGRTQAGPLVYVGGGPIRNFEMQDAANLPAAIQDPKTPKIKAP
ncbi:MAG: hypothetical protein KF752_10090 [Pirellulaceae bacterium]|nr:hypothetical protein [Pirellulaceae bacterium]